MDDNSLTPFTDVSLGIDMSGSTQIPTSIDQITSVGTSLDTTPGFNWNNFAGELAQTGAGLLAAFTKVQIAGTAQKNALPGQILGTQLGIAQTQAQSMNTMLMAVGIIGAVTLISVFAFKK